MSKTLIIIPVRMGSKRFPGKPLVKIRNKTMLEHVWERAKESKVGKVIIACCDKEVKDFLEEKKLDYIMTRKSLKTGTDRVFSAYSSLKNKRKYNYIINLQGDVPFINYKHIKKISDIIKKNNIEIATLVSEIKNKKIIFDTNVVKTVLSKYKNNYFKALYFSRAAIPFNANKYYEHIGIYAYTALSLKKFVNLDKSHLEKQESLEQLRALDNNMKIVVGKVNLSPISIDIPEDINKLTKNKI